MLEILSDHFYQNFKCPKAALEPFESLNQLSAEEIKWPRSSEAAEEGNSEETHGLVFHACEDNIEHLRERGLSSGLVDEVAAGQVDVVAGPDRQQHRALMNLNVRRGHSRQQGLDGDESKS